MLGDQKCWEYKNVRSSKMLGVQKYWELKNVGNTKMLVAQKCWVYKNVGSSKMFVWLVALHFRNGILICCLSKFFLGVAPGNFGKPTVGHWVYDAKGNDVDTICSTYLHTTMATLNETQTANTIERYLRERTLTMAGGY